MTKEEVEAFYKEKFGADLTPPANTPANATDYSKFNWKDYIAPNDTKPEDMADYYTKKFGGAYGKKDANATATDDKKLMLLLSMIDYLKADDEYGLPKKNMTEVEIARYN